MKSKEELKIILDDFIQYKDYFENPPEEIDGLQLRCTNDSKKFKDTAWFKQNRIKPSNWE